MSSTSNTSTGGGLGFTGALTILFIALKLTHVIDWSWWWVLSPLWISAALVAAIVAVVLLVAWITVSVNERRSGVKHYRGAR